MPSELCSQGAQLKKTLLRGVVDDDDDDDDGGL
jgi:hypothetical protein